jgi:nucleoside-diphosphate-sugar epimerase
VDVVIAGGHGKVALALTRRLSERGDSVRSLIRNPDHEADIRAAGAQALICDLEAVDKVDLAELVGTADAAVFAAGAGPGSGPQRKWSMDYGGAAKLIAAALANEIPRYVMLSSQGADPSAPGDDTFAEYLRAKGQADEDLRATSLDYTIVRPTFMSDEPPAGKVELAEHVERGEVPRADVAHVLAAVLHERATIRKAFEVRDGDVPVEEAVAALRDQQPEPAR